jgi:hypothetical protein
MRLAVWVVLVELLISAAPSRAQALSEIETHDLRLLYRDPSQTYLAPHAGRCFENSMRFQRWLFDYVPSQKVTVLLNDYSDSGNASATGIPHNALMVETSPLESTFETVTPNERLNFIMNHELVHIVTVDKAAPSDHFFRKVFGGKVTPVAEDPESIIN